MMRYKDLLELSDDGILELKDDSYLPSKEYILEGLTGDGLVRIDRIVPDDGIIDDMHYVSGNAWIVPKTIRILKIIKEY
jgi:hypothetical protein